MTRRLERVSAADPVALMRALRSALDRSGPAVLPTAAGSAAGSAGADEAAGPSGSQPQIQSKPASQSESQSQVQSPAPRFVPQSGALVIETSGSTGVPKRVLLSADAVLASVAASETALGGPGQWLLALPAHYVAGVQVLARSIAAATTPVVLGPGSFDALAFARATSQLDGDLRFTSLVPAQLLTLVAAASDSRRVRRALRSFDAILVGGQRLDQPLADRAEMLGARVVRTYGSSETAGGCVYDGVPLPGVSARVNDGQVELAGPMLADGYLDDRERTDAAFHTAPDRDGVLRRWYRTGDTGTVVDGRVSVTGRIDNVIVSGGTNVSLDRVEEVVRALPGFERAVVVPVEDERWGQVPVVAVPADDLGQALGRDGALPDVVTEVRRAALQALGPAAQPANVVPFDDLPVLASGKPDRRSIRSFVESRRGRL